MEAKILKLIKNNDGFTVDSNLKPVKNGYAVSPYKGLEISGQVLSLSTVRKFLNKRPDNQALIGGWRDNTTGIYYLDYSHVTPSRREAVKIAKKHKQIAVYNLNTNKEIRVS